MRGPLPKVTLQSGLDARALPGTMVLVRAAQTGRCHPPSEVSGTCGHSGPPHKAEGTVSIARVWR